MKRWIALATLLTALMGCASSGQKQSLYQALGEQAGIAQLVEEFINVLLVDERIQHHFEESDLDRFHDKLVEQICELGGGPCKYTGKAMAKIHNDFDIDDAQFNALVEDLMTAMDNINLPIGTQNRLLALLAPMHKDIVNM